MAATLRRFDRRHVAFTRRGRGSAQVGPRCHTCGGAGVWFTADATTGERRPHICRDCPAFYTKGKTG